MAPTSTPRVGSSKMISLGFCTSDLAITTFCWLPPESSMMRALPSMARTLRRIDPGLGQLRVSIRHRYDLERVGAGCYRRRSRCFRRSTWSRRSLRPCGPRSRRRCRRAPPAAARDSAPACPRTAPAAMEQVALQHACDDLHHLGAAGADQAEDAGDLPGIDRERRVAHHAAAWTGSATLSTFRPYGRARAGRAPYSVALTACGRPWRWMIRRDRIPRASAVTTCSPSRSTVMRSAASAPLPAHE